MKNTQLLYLTDSYQKTARAKVISLTEKEANRVTLILDQTIFYPQGGGQPSDTGTISFEGGVVKINHVSLSNKGDVLHNGALQGELKPGAQVTLKIDWARRFQHMQLHTAGHIIDEAVKELFPDVYGIKGSHGIDNQNYIEFNSRLSSADIKLIETKVNEIILADEPISSEIVTLAEIEKRQIKLPFKLPQNKPLRLITIGDRAPVPDGGTQLKSTALVGKLTLSLRPLADHSVIDYKLIKPKKGVVNSNKQTITLNQFRSELNKIKNEFDSSKVDATSAVNFLGKKGHINKVSKLIPQLSVEDRAIAGKLLNELKTTMQDLVSRKAGPDHDTSWFDATEPGILPQLGHLHPITQAIEEISRIFESIGFTRVRYPEIDYDYYVFESLNMPTNHPARDEWETFFTTAKPHPEKGSIVLSTHTSNGQVREMERIKPPIRMLNIAKCYRRQQDLTHTAMFHQFEGLVIDKGINIQNLKWTLDYFARKYYGDEAKSRIRPFMFKFTEPSFEVDFSCTHCGGQGCRFCKSGWHEVGGSGMVHPNVLRAGGIDPEVYTGFAFGWGIERVFTLKPGLNLADIRPLYSTNLEFLANF